ARGRAIHARAEQDGAHARLCRRRSRVFKRQVFRLGYDPGSRRAVQSWQVPGAELHRLLEAGKVGDIWTFIWLTGHTSCFATTTHSHPRKMKKDAKSRPSAASWHR